MVRVISGKYKRRLLKTLSGTDITRPTSDRVKENLFNILSFDIQGAIVWDLFAGSGALGIEALSRGAQHVTFVEQSAGACQIISENLRTLGIPSEQYRLVSGSVTDFLQAHARAAEKSSANNAALVSVVLADPPYQSNWYDEALDLLAATKVCAPECLVVLEMNSDRILSHSDELTWQLEDERKYGLAQLQFWRFLKEGGMK
ncbi:MAG: rRNA ((966)-N(2))-methyltransferase RsmD [Pseudomonadota bacterium]